MRGGERTPTMVKSKIKRSMREKRQIRPGEHTGGKEINNKREQNNRGNEKSEEKKKAKETNDEIKKRLKRK